MTENVLVRGISFTTKVMGSESGMSLGECRNISLMSESHAAEIHVILGISYKDCVTVRLNEKSLPALIKNACTKHVF